MTTRDPINIVGTTIAEKYRIERLVGEGGFAVVYRAQHTIWNQPVAIKFFNGLSAVPVDQRASNIPPDLARAVMLCLEKNPDDRFASAQAFVTALDSGNVPNLPAPRPMQAPLRQMPGRRASSRRR